MKKRVLTLLLALVLVLGLFPVAPKAAAETMSTEICPCCGKKFSDISWTNAGGGWFQTRDLSKPGHYKLTKAFTAGTEFQITGKVVVDFAGYKLQAKSSSRGFLVKNGGMLTLLNSGGSNGRVEGHRTSAEGGAIKVETGGTLNIIGGRVIGTSMSYDGGAIYNAGTVNMAGGEIEGGKANGKSGGNIYNAGTLNLYGGLVESGSAKTGGNITNSGTLNIYGGTIEGGTAVAGGDGGNICNSGTLNMHGGTITAGAVTGDDGFGGNIYNATNAILNIHDGTVSAGTSEDHGGNIFMTGSTLNIYGGAISDGTTTGGKTADGTAFAGYGGNIYATKSAAKVSIYGGTVSRGSAEGSNGGNLVLLSGAQGYMYGGTVENGLAGAGSNIFISGTETLEDGSKKYSGMYILAGIITATGDGDDIYKASTSILQVYSCNYTGQVFILDYIADCCCYMEKENGYTIWNAGYKDGNCTDCMYAEAMAAGSVTPVEGIHTYVDMGENTYRCLGCGKVRVVENVVATVDGNLYGDMAEAVADARTGSIIKLMTDVTVTELAVKNATLDLNGFVLTADVFNSAVSGNIIDTSPQQTGRLNCADVALAGNNTQLPVTYQDSICLCPVDFTQWVEPVDVDTTKVKFYFTQRAAQTIIDDAVKAGNTEVDVLLKLTWTDGTGTAKEKTVSFGSELVKKYAEKWNGRVFVATVHGTAGISNLQMAYQVTSTAASGVTLSAKTIKSFGYIHENLTWEQINSYPIKTTDMTVEEMRQHCVDFMEFNKTYLWTPSETVNYIRTSAGTADVMTQGTIYGGLPYVGVATGNPYRMMDYINPETGLLDMQKALPMLGTKERLEYTDLKYFGSQCSIAVYWAWGRVMNSTAYKWTSSATPYNNFIILGDVVIPSTVKSWNNTYGTDECVAENGEQVMFGGYAKLQKADGMVYYTTAGHLIMAYSDPVVVYNDDGTIDGDASYIYIIDQGQAWRTGTNESGDTYQYKSSVNEKKTFTQLFNSNYIPFTFEEFLGTDPIEVTEVELVKGSTTYVKGTVAEADRSFVTTKITGNLTWSNLMASKITTNYGVVDAYIIIKDVAGNEMYKHAVRTASAGNTALELEESGEMVTTWETKALTSGKTYSAEIVVQLSTGERPTIWNGQLTYDK